MRRTKDSWKTRSNPLNTIRIFPSPIGPRKTMETPYLLLKASVFLVNPQEIMGLVNPLRVINFPVKLLPVGFLEVHGHLKWSRPHALVEIVCLVC